MPFEVYEGFAQIVIPILQSRGNSTLKFYKRQGLHFGERRREVMM